MNKIYLLGRVVRDVEYVQTKTEKKMVNNCLAIDQGKDAEGNKQTMFVDITLFDKTAEIFKLYVEIEEFNQEGMRDGSKQNTCA